MLAIFFIGYPLINSKLLMFPDTVSFAREEAFLFANGSMYLNVFVVQVIESVSSKVVLIEFEYILHVAVEPLRSNVR